ncbi:outer membrane lipoprotein carrier protein LolA [bacterium M00.F.Ca.ET.228.01.1.1]|uniref:LolA family protein n=1 Tax=Paraburkholderia phenoliruptrix TaxID=252970 RepID=UPI0010922D04|nr:outer membrane lipoprotein carrier protein LolA [Paraburkholderia phenoliruptrix]TGP43889.1 outer membrane lipoprotein carrier protein LolA [bacterium M00.F.Ca.ET.228.01.1.1]TGS01552.1 outer membrane lipoprotein carrier protein LolA [bacterium M00.F.Ca.ET.191.01.1.1]TGU08842.1 outer membrane lipoprotein carrier protein LolA [bacterium M00.F.Ca.ET.155.01.1.1]MBW0449066.1 outer membrane lipoprotein carrier protein LolA [Paraburkholderia phenoliruptrix]MBW9097475.1 outer membrane lipoprotein c
MGTMNVRRRLVNVLCVAALTGAPGVGTAPVSAAAADGNPALVSQIASHLAAARGVRAQFTQTQTLAAMKQPLISTGSLLFLRERGVIWQIATPYKATYVITDAGVAELDARGQRVTTRGAHGTRGVAQVSKMMRAMLGGDLSALYSQFDVQAEGSAGNWRMRLTPNQPQVAQSIKSIQMNGGDYLQNLRIALANGDTTQLEFSRSETVSEPAPAERSLLGAP